MRLTKINNKLLQFKLATCPHENIFNIIKEALFESEREVDDLHIDEHDAYSVDKDSLFYQKQKVVDDHIEDLGVYNKLIKVWYYNCFNPALIATEGKIKREDYGIRE